MILDSAQIRHLVGYGAALIRLGISPVEYGDCQLVPGPEGPTIRQADIPAAIRGEAEALAAFASLAGIPGAAYRLLFTEAGDPDRGRLLTLAELRPSDRAAMTRWRGGIAAAALIGRTCELLEQRDIAAWQVMRTRAATAHWLAEVISFEAVEAASETAFGELAGRGDRPEDWYAFAARFVA
ncbi:MAG TPA: hypothetical protein VNQ78_19360 [Paracoccus sp. (in: a-proteobacteria)]|uniref:hypothetical protein n=1 Tax=Paracoccus sp. TaxID=267 RepID=UPI002C319427|nr:hypothetical protein [Paracoccus sp. (in: a-proteobacteria)]HWL58815.1 hypothetical protein [Paracoccus sp. (in: a-proteobacteria)]